jgi:hypothetical protein
MSTYSHKELFRQSQITINNTLNNPVILQKLRDIGFTLEDVQQGETLRVQALDWRKARQKKYGTKVSTTDTFNQQWEALKEIYSEHVALARLTFKKDRVMLKELALKGKRSNSPAEWMEQASAFYGSIADIQKPLAKYGVKKEDLEQAKAALDTLKETYNQRINYQGSAQDATQKYQEATDALHAWMREFREAARYALRHDEQLLESLGILVVSR